MSTDRIEREIKIAAPVERVWAVLTEPQHVGTWFGAGTPAEIDLRPGGVMVLNHGEHGTYPTVIVELDPPFYMSYRWASAFPGVTATESNSTLVEFSLTPEADGTILRVVESGFDSISIPPERDPSAGYESHSQGWTGVVEKLKQYTEGQDASPLVTTV
ncbi:MAG TPA: SRPBCC family protein [Acidimicrobiales bacterium]|nr:SRPBCC family protein [Acidimicrobiales bacterium]